VQDAEDVGTRQKRVVRLFSEEYYDLLKNNNDFAKAQAVGWNVSMNVGGERIEVEKDGSTKEKDLELEKQQEQPAQPDPNQQCSSGSPHQQQDVQQGAAPTQRHPAEGPGPVTAIAGVPANEVHGQHGMHGKGNKT